MATAPPEPNAKSNSEHEWSWFSRIADGFVTQSKFLRFASNILDRLCPTQMPRSFFDCVARPKRRYQVPNIHLGPGLAVVDVLHRLNIGSPLRGRAAKQPTPPLSSQAAHYSAPSLR